MLVIGYKQSGRIAAVDHWDTEGYVRAQVDTGGELDVEAGSIKIHQLAIDSCALHRLVKYREPVVRCLFVIEDRRLWKTPLSAIHSVGNSVTST